MTQVVIIGRGRVGTSLYRLFLDLADNDISARLVSHAEAVSDKAIDIVRADIVFLAVPDDCIEKMAKSLAEAITNRKEAGTVTSKDAGKEAVAEADGSWKNIPKNAKLFLHMSGLHTSKQLDALAGLGFLTGSLHPIVAIRSKSSEDILKNAYYTYEGADEGWDILLKTTDIFGKNITRISSSKKVEYHLACVFVSNLVVGLANMGEKLFLNAGIEEDIATKLWKDLFIKNAQSTVDTDTESALTGPVIRGDLQTVEAHLKALREIDSDGSHLYFLETYKAISKDLIEISQRRKPNFDYSDIIDSIS